MLEILYSPEFLVESSARKDTFYPERTLVGYTYKSFDIARKVLKYLPRASYERILPSTETEVIKYFGNAFLATRVIFANQMYDLCNILGINYDRVIDAASKDKRIGGSHFDIFHDGYRGYSGKCLPKDVKALIQKAEFLGFELGLLKIVDKINESLLIKKF